MAQRHYRGYEWYSSCSANWARWWAHGKSVYLFHHTCSISRLRPVASGCTTPDGCHCNSCQSITYSVNLREDCRGKLSTTAPELRQPETGEGNVIENTNRLCRAHQDVVIYIYM
jgi:hypothetical protein